MNEVVWIASVHQWKTELHEKEIKAIVSEQEYQYAQNTYALHKRDSILISYYLLRKLFSYYYASISPKEWQILGASSGKPIVRQKPIHFSLSRCCDFIVIALSERHAIGVDIEKAHKEIDWNPIAQRYFSKEECRYLSLFTNSHEATNAFYWLWTRKEAYVKLRGLRLSEQLPSFAQKTQVEHDEIGEFYFHNIDTRLFCTLASPSPIPPSHYDLITGML